MKDLLNTIAKRYSCRAFDGQPVKKEQLDAIALAAVQSPSGMNVQPWLIRVITDKNLIDEMDSEGMLALSRQEDPSAYQRFMDRGGKLYYDAPCMFLILKRPGADLDCGIVSENIALAATALGLGNVICGMAAIPFNGARGEEFKALAGFEEGYEFGMTVLVGHAVGEGTPHQPDWDKVRFVG